LNLDGELVGINTAIATDGLSRSNAGVGFAIPINQAKRVIEDLLDDGTVSRGWLGVQIQNIDDAIVKALNLENKNGALIISIVPDSPEYLDTIGWIYYKIGKYQLALDYLLKIPDLFESKALIKLSKNNKIILKCVDEAINKLIEHRKKDGKVLQKDILSKVKKINRDLQKIVRLSSSNSKTELKTIKGKINNVIPDITLDMNRLYQEVALIMEKKDINEELSRLEGHMKLLDDYIVDYSSGGKKINFLLQEINREVNTIGSKVDDLSIKHMVVDIKDNVEKIREQAQNIL